MPSPTRVLLLRHAETAAPYVFHGAESDVGLSERGLRQIEQTTPIIKAEQPVIVVSSAMRRAIESAMPLAQACGVPHRVEPTLHERQVGSLSGRPFGEQPWPETLHRWTSGETGFAPDGAESFDAIHERVRPAWDRYAREYAGQTYAMVVHGVVIRVLLLSLGTGLGPKDWHSFHTLNMGITELVQEEGKWRIVRIADARHLS